jgi:hypothetical protein
MRRTMRLIAAATLAVALTGCANEFEIEDDPQSDDNNGAANNGAANNGDDEDELECVPDGFDSPEACGGTLIGTWAVISVCPLGSPEACIEGGEETGTKLEERKVTGTLVFDRDGSYRNEATYQDIAVLTCPQGCAQIQPLFNAPCEPGETSGCVCYLTLPPGDFGAVEGTWETTATTLILTADGDPSGEAVGYCVQGDVLFLGVGGAYRRQ